MPQIKCHFLPLILSDDAKHFQDMLNIFSEHYKNWKLKINIEKSKIVIFGNYIRIKNITFCIDGQSIEIVKEFKNLGVYKKWWICTKY